MFAGVYAEGDEEEQSSEMSYIITKLARIFQCSFPLLFVSTPLEGRLLESASFPLADVSDIQYLQFHSNFKRHQQLHL